MTHTRGSAWARVYEGRGPVSINRQGSGPRGLTGSRPQAPITPRPAPPCRRGSEPVGPGVTLCVWGRSKWGVESAVYP